MPTFEEEALKRAQQMHSRVPPYNGRRDEKASSVKPDKTEKSESPVKAEINSEPLAAVPKQDGDNQSGMLDFLMKDKEQSLILLLLLLLYGESADPALLLALMYLLI